MCGISGIISLQGTQADPRALQAMNDCLKHRGPDGEGFLFYDGKQTHTAFGKDTPEHIRHASMPHAPQEAMSDLHSGFIFGFGHRRLAILDLGENGHQPLCNVASDLWITYNGEIYNYLELRAELQTKGHVFRTRTDTEVVLAAYREWGTDCLNHFNGMWAFVLFDANKKIFFGSRDRFGVKPFYYYTDKNRFVFASEQKALLRLPDIRSGINPKAVADYFIAGEIEYQEEGVFQNILELFPSQAFILGLNDGVFRQWQWYNLPVNETYESFHPDRFQTYCKRTEELIRDAVRIRLRSDVPVGSCLSGGIDSSSLVGIMSSFRKEDQAMPPFHTFTASFPGLSCDETSWARIAAEHSSSIWHSAQPELPELIRDLEQLVYSQDSPLWSTSTYAQFRVMRLVQEQGIKVILDGQGGDELFAGYTPYYTRYVGDMLRHFRLGAASSAIHKAGPFPGNILSLGKSHLKNNLLHHLPASVQMKITRSYFKDMDYLDPSLLNLYADEKRKKSDARSSSLNGLLKKEFVNTRLKLYLKCEDRSSMWHSVESRTPFADDHPLIEYIFNIPGSYKIHEGTFKYLLRESMKKYIPAPILERTDKMGYNTPNNEWVTRMKGDLKDYFTDSLRPYLQIDKLRKEYDSFFDISTASENGRIFKFMAFAAWFKVFKP
ncbi:MAG TPA: asparagine synthase (glutamine-hydrolyzing) [Bacteroidia bacterium]|jgi:asparagine synthase (glutamine-hydrolysing)|nr:asparagine synthase (glutamine-hydrolyzing) [Bacteroidia bacterium]